VGLAADVSTFPRYIALIADGNARWARTRGLSVTEGHAAAADTALARISDAMQLGVSELTIYALSTENWSRPAAEINGLVELIAARISLETPRLDRAGIRLRFIGRREGLGETLVEEMAKAQALTSENEGMRLFVALNYGGRAEILDAARRFAGGSEQQFRECLYAPEMHDPDVILRTGGERRLSNYLLWQAAYAELVFRDELWPDFDRPAFESALAEFGERHRRFGGRSALAEAYEEHNEGAQVA
jgi:undecaprenyl diphosphate synthase